MKLDITFIWQKTANLLAHKTTIWLTLTLLIASLAAWKLSVDFAPKPNKQREFLLSRRAMYLHSGLAIFFWVANWLLS